eukprot:gene23395-24866_t
MERTTISGVISIFPAAVFLSYFVDDAIDDEHALNNYYLALYIQPFFHSGTSEMSDGQDELESDTTGTLDADKVHMWVKCWVQAPSVDEDGGDSIRGQGGVI